MIANNVEICYDALRCGDVYICRRVETLSFEFVKGYAKNGKLIGESNVSLKFFAKTTDLDM